ncbi:MAG TPA: amidohydrolase family protein [Acidimicrobiales bacterium]|nr:amidohydrolase family protein [Acidimicrobiales bacterium]
MAMPSDVPVIDLMMGLPEGHKKNWYEFLRKGFMDDESKDMEFPAQYMFKNVPADIPDDADPIAVVLEEMDHFGIEKAMLGIGGRAGSERTNAHRALHEHPDRFFGSYEVDPNRGMEGVRDLVRAHDEFGIKAATAFPAGMVPQVPINDKKFYPLYAKCIELDIPICITTGVPGPRLPMLCQKTELLDEVCWFFPELRVVMRHGAEPWDALAVKLMLKWPNLYYSTSAFAPKYYPRTIIDYANTRGAHKVLYAGYFPMGLSLERIFKDMHDVPFRDHVWPKFLRENAVKVFNL